MDNLKFNSFPDSVKFGRLHHDRNHMISTQLLTEYSIIIYTWLLEIISLNWILQMVFSDENQYTFGNNSDSIKSGVVTAQFVDPTTNEQYTVQNTTKPMFIEIPGTLKSNKKVTEVLKMGHVKMSRYGIVIGTLYTYYSALLLVSQPALCPMSSSKSWWAGVRFPVETMYNSLQRSVKPINHFSNHLAI